MANELKKTGSAPAMVNETDPAGTEKDLLTIDERRALTQWRKLIEMVVQTVVTTKSPAAVITGFDMLFPVYKQNEMHEVDQIRTDPDTRQPKRCVTAYDGSVQTAWTIKDGTIWYAYHGTDKDHAYPYVAPTGAHDMYKAGEYMTYTDGAIYKCLSDTNYSPEDYAQAWEKAE